VNLARLFRYWRRLRKRPRRYADLHRLIHDNRCRRLMEIGTWNGLRATAMIDTAALHHPPGSIEYIGFDLFEDQTEEDVHLESSKRPPAEEVVRRRLEATGARFRLYKGNTRDTLPRHLRELGEPDFVFIDGGHSIQTIRSDWDCVARIMGPHTIVVFDDYYENSEAELPGLGCQALVAGLDPARYAVTRLEPVDEFPREWGTLRIRMVAVRRR
jgi:predicted O-methyltransferase YrrM